MSDIHLPATRSRNMSAIRGKDTKPEMLIRRALHARGFRYRLHSQKLPGSPDLVLPKYRAAIFVHGCFWHRHNCSMFHWPSSRKDFWRKKLDANYERDERNVNALLVAGWRVAVVWECCLRGKHKRGDDSVADTLSDWLTSDKYFFTIPSNV
ncbi:T/G mismatch-specific endonuclease [Spongiibacter sp. IMCC21906]|jgi:DNA mismatch endonuclease (patch repair protein)|uniref:very short patch repair endonuclease n=1 Tax=Spongiibacter sp. IMCC21906 TaxID=1620392 RepID=UPI00062DF8F2|nr:T/G mismatch-specific endonuclease [Spongiibacter sp. IMCC21906]